MAWMTRDEPREFSRMPNAPDMETLTYWVTRLEPLIRAEDTNGEIIVVFANRTGIEGDATYAGTSAVIGIENGEVTVYGLLGRGEKELLVVDTSQPPYGKLVYRPEHLTKPAIPNDEAMKPSPEAEPGYQAAGSSDQTSSPSKESARAAKNHKKKEADQKYSNGTQILGEDGLTPVAMQVTITPTTATPQSQPLGFGRQNGAGMTENRKTQSQGTVEEVSEGAAIKKPIAPITVPLNTPYTTANTATLNGDATQTGADGALRSPRMAVRPKLVIPQSPNTIPQQMYPDQPISAASAISARSIQSIKSNDSEASIQTIRSNPRPPEDSTPYPHSGLPLSGYPQRKKIYGGFVTVRSEDNVPVTPFEDMSPTSAMSWGWPHSANPFGNLNSAGGWRTRTPIGSVPEPFPWTALRGVSRTRSRSTSRVNHNIAAVRQPTPPATSWYNAAKSPEPNTAVHTWKPNALDDRHPSTEETDEQSGRPASPKSRNASRSRMHERSDSATGVPDFSAAAKHLENVSRRVNSVSRTRETSQKDRANLHAESSPEPANESPDKDGYVFTASELDNATIPIVASPSLMLSDVQRRMMVPTPVAVDYYRSASNSVQMHNSPSLSSSTKPSAPRTSSRSHTNVFERSPSRGRQRDPKPFPSQSEPRFERHVRSTSLDSTRNDLLHRHVRRVSNGGSQVSRNHSRNTIHLPEGYVPEDFERVEEIACPNCPVHGRRSSSASNHTGHVSGWRVRSQNRPRRRRSTSQVLGGSFGSPAPEMIQIRTRKAAPLERPQAEPRSIPEPRFAPAPVQRPKKAVSRVKRTFAASPVPRPSTAPLPFNPPTPKAMAYVPVSDELNSPGEDDFVLSPSVKGKFVEQDSGLGVRLRAAA